MERVLASFLIVVGLFLSTFSEAADTGSLSPAGDSPQRVVLGIPMGALRDQVEAIFNEANIPQLKRDADMSVYKEPLAKIRNGGMTGLIFYENRLAKVAVHLDVESQTAEPYISRYQELKESLKEKYGKPVKDIEYVEDSYRPHLLLAIKTGKGVYMSSWETPDLDIALILRGDNFSINFTLHYEYRSLFKKFIQKQKKQEKDSL